MRNIGAWTPSKYELVGSKLTGSRDRRHLAVGSRLVAHLVAEELGRVVSIHARGRLLDLGCGRVPLYSLYAPRVLSVTCADWPGSLHGARHVDVFCDVGRGLPFRPSIADTVVSSDVLEHLAHPSTAFAEFARVLSPGGVLLLNTPFMYRVHEAPHDYLRHTRFSLERLCRDAGLEIVELVEVGGLIDVVIDNIGKGLAEVPHVGAPLSAFVQTLARAFGRTSLGRRVRRATRGSFPLSYVLVARRGEVVAPPSPK